MKKIVLFLYSFLLLSCEQKVNTNDESHLKLFNLKGNVKQVTHDYILHEITDISYKPIGKANPRFLDLGGIEDVDLSYVRALSEFNYYYAGTFFDSYNIFLSELLDKSFYASRYDSHEINFNTDGMVTNFKGKKNKKLIYSVYFEYDKDKLVKVKKFENTKSEYLGKREDINIEFEYDKNNLICKKVKKNSDGYLLNSSFTYSINNENKEILVIENRRERFSNNKNRNSVFEYRIVLDDRDNIKEILYENQNKTIIFNNNLVKKITEYNKTNELTFNIELNYNDEKISQVKKTNYGNLNEIYFQYDQNGDLENVKCNDESKKNLVNDLKFSYEYDDFKNWTKQSYSIDRAKYDNYLQYLKKRKKYSNDYYVVYGYSPFSLKEDVDAEIERKILSKYSSKIDVERRVVYY